MAWFRRVHRPNAPIRGLSKNSGLFSHCRHNTTEIALCKYIFYHGGTRTNTDSKSHCPGDFLTQSRKDAEKYPAEDEDFEMAPTKSLNRSKRSKRAELPQNTLKGEKKRQTLFSASFCVFCGQKVLI
jgi:hypothetical protein